MIPSTAMDLTPEFLTRALRTQLPGIRVEDFRCEPVTGERGIASALVRVHLYGDQPELPARVIAKFPPADPELRGLLNDMGFFEREVGFYRQLAGETPVHTPVCYSADFDAETGRAFRLFEDLANARNGDSAAPGTVEVVAAVLTELAHMHARWWQDATLSDKPWLRPRSMLAPSAVAEVFERGWPSFVSKLSISVDDEILAIKARISATLRDAATSLFDTGPRTLIHNDLQGDNMFFPDDPERPVVFIDWQLAAYARGAVDVVNVIRGSLEPQLRRSTEADLLRGYHQVLVGAGVDNYALDQCESDLTCITALVSSGFVGDRWR